MTLLAELPVLRTDLKVFLPLYFFSLSRQLEFEDQPPYTFWVASRNRRAMHAHVSSYSTGCTFKSAPHGLAVNVLHCTCMLFVVPIKVHPSRRCATRGVCYVSGRPP